MKNSTTLSTSVHSKEQAWLGEYFTKRRKEIGLSQKALADKMGTLASFIGKVETGDRRLDIFEFIKHCEFLDIKPSKLLDLIVQYQDNQ